MKTQLLLSAACVSLLLASPGRAATSGWGQAPSGGETPPVDYLLEKYSATGTLGDEIGRFKGTISLRVLAPGWNEIPLMEDTTAVTGLTAGAQAESVLLRRRDGRYWLLIGKPGVYQIGFDFVTRVTTERGERSTQIPMLGAVTNTVEITVPEQSVTYATQPTLKSEKRAAEGKTIITLYGNETGAVTLSWTGKATVDTLDPMVFVDQKATVRVISGLLRYEAELQYSVLQGAVEDFSVSFPKTASLIQVEGESMRTWDVDESGAAANILRVKLSMKMDKSYRLALVFEQPVGTMPAEVSLPPVETLDVRREKGTITIHAAKGLQVEQSTATGVSQVDVGEAWDGGKGRGLSAKPDLAYQYLKRPFTIGLRVSAVEPKITGVVETLVSASRDLLRVTSTLRYEVRDAGVFRLRVRLSEGLRLVAVRDGEKGGGRDTINNWKVEDQVVTVELRSKAEGAYAMIVETELPLTDGVEEVTLPEIELLGIERETGHIAVSPRLDTKVEALTTDGQIDVKDLPSALRMAPEGVSLAYRYIRHPHAFKIRVGKVQAEITVENSTGVTIKEKELVLHAQIEYTIRKAGIFELRLSFPKTLRLMPLKGDSIEDWRVDKEAEELVVKFRSRVDGAYTLNIQANQTLDDVLQGVVLPRIAAIGVKREEGHIAVRTAAAIKLKADDKTAKNIRSVDIAELPRYLKGETSGETLALAFEYYRQPWNLDLTATKVTPMVTAETFSFVAIGEGQERTVAQVDLTIQNAGIDEFYLEMPPGAKPDQVKIEGANIKLQEPVADAKRPGLYRILLQARVEKSYSVTVSFMRDAEATVTYRSVRCLGPGAVRDDAWSVASEKGWIVVSPEGNAGITLRQTTGADCQAIDLTNIPALYTQDITLPIIHAFKYVNHPYGVELEVARHEDIASLVAAVEQAMLNTRVAEDGNTYSTFRLSVRNNGKQFLRMTMPEGATVIEGYVSGGKVTLSKGEKPNQVQVFIAGASEGTTVFPVEIVYRHALFDGRTDELGFSGTIALDAPKVDIPVLKLGWQVEVPENLRLTHNFGAFRQVQTLGQYTQSLVQLDQTYQRRQKARQNLSLNRWEAQIQEGQRAAGQQKRAAQGRIVGRMPNTARRVRTYHFEKLFAFVDEGKVAPPVTLRFSYAHERYILFVRCVLVLLMTGLLVALWICTPREVRWGVFAGGALIFSAVHTLSADYYPAYLSTLVAMAWIGVGVQLLPLMGAGWRALRPARDETFHFTTHESPMADDPETAPTADEGKAESAEGDTSQENEGDAEPESDAEDEKTKGDAEPESDPEDEKTKDE